MAFSPDDLDRDIGFGAPVDDWRQPDAVAERAQRQAEAKARKPRETRFNRISFGELRTKQAKAIDFAAFSTS